jgi:N6-adenosine-specific RNA methylase IME4/uncharacterized protein YoaH (UPF0181 family)
MTFDLLSYVEALTVPEADRKAQLEATIERGMQTFVEVGLALMEIRDGRLYRAEYSTFEEYCNQRWGWGRNYTNKLIASAEVVENLGTIVPILPATESQARPLAALEPEQQRKAWERVLETAPNGKITAAIVTQAAKEIRQERTDQRRQERIEKIVQIAHGNSDLAKTATLYPIVYVDPPWRYEYSPTDNREIENHYPTMTLEEICLLPVAEIATPDSVLFLWTTSPKLAESMQVIEAWGYAYKTCMVWDKERMGMGYYARQQHELLLISTRGAVPVPDPANRPPSVIRARRDNEHSAKPAEFYDVIERMYPDLPKIELFARGRRAGWAAWGNQA